MDIYIYLIFTFGESWTSVFSSNTARSLILFLYMNLDFFLGLDFFGNCLSTLSIFLFVFFSVGKWTFAICTRWLFSVSLEWEVYEIHDTYSSTHSLSCRPRTTVSRLGSFSALKQPSPPFIQWAAVSTWRLQLMLLKMGSSPKINIL